MASSDAKGAVSASTQNSPGAPAGSSVERRTVRETGRISDHRSAHSPRPTPEGPARDNPIAGPRAGTTRSEPSASATARGQRHTMSPVLRRPPRAPRSHPVMPGAHPPGVKNGTTASGKPTGAPRATGPDEARRTRAEPPGTTGRHAAGDKQGTRTGAKQQRPPGAANPGGVHNRQRTTAQGQVPRNTKPTGHKPQPGVVGRSGNTSPSTHSHTTDPSQEWRGTSGEHTKTRTP